MRPLEFLFSLERLGMKFGLENMRELCRALDHPEHSFRSLIVAGTNGKGSVTAMTSAALHAAGYRAARYTSPHLEKLEERFVIGEREVSASDLEDAAALVRDRVEGLMREGTLESYPTFFECTTAIAFELFRRADVEVAVVEVGLGGRLDATNVLTPMAVAITSIDFDHQALLGNTLDAIAREKAGVIKPGIPVVTGPLPAEAAAVIASVCDERGARLMDASERVRVSAVEPGDSRATIATPHRTIEHVRLALQGAHQRANVAVAVALLEAFEEEERAAASDRGHKGLTDAAIRAGLEHVRWPGRLEMIRWHGTDVLLDAAHNAAGARALAAHLTAIGWRNITFVVGIMQDKDALQILQPILPRTATVICTTPSTPRAMPAADLASIVAPAAGPSTTVRVIADPAEALREACRGSTRVLVAGSIFLIGPLRGILR